MTPSFAPPGRRKHNIVSTGYAPSGFAAAASNEQSQGIEQINTAVGQMDTVTQQNAANAEESASASEELSAQAGELNKMVVELRTLIEGADTMHAQAAVKAKAPTAQGPRFALDADHTPAAGKKTASRKGTPEHRTSGGKARPQRLRATGEAAMSPEEQIPLNDQELTQF